MSEKPADLRALLGKAWEAGRVSCFDTPLGTKTGRQIAAMRDAYVGAALAAGEPAVPSGTLITRLYAPNPSGEPAGTTPQEPTK